MPSFANVAEDGQWTMPAKDYASTCYSGLDESNTGNVRNLKVAWTFSTGVNRGQEAAPIVAGTTMYVVSPYPNILYALDLTRPGAAKWKYEPQPAAGAQGVACCDVVNRGAVFSNGKLFYNTLKQRPSSRSKPPTAASARPHYLLRSEQRSTCRGFCRL